jgi:hypothetical protein
MKRLALEDMAKTNEIARLEREKLLKEDEDRKRMEDEENERKRLTILAEIEEAKAFKKK